MSDEKKIFVDEDWKSQVEAEKRAFEESPQGAQPAPGSPGALPAASFEMLLTMLATEAMVALGQVPNPMTGQVALDPEHARYSIDMLDVLEEKTKGNLNADEAKVLDELLHQLRMVYVMAQQSAGGIDLGNAPSQGESQGD